MAKVTITFEDLPDPEGQVGICAVYDPPIVGGETLTAAQKIATELINALSTGVDMDDVFVTPGEFQ